MVTIVISGTYSLSNFREDLQRMYRRAGLKGEGLCFLLADSQVVDERMLVFVNDLLASGEIPDLFPQASPREKRDRVGAIQVEGQYHTTNHGPDPDDPLLDMYVAQWPKPGMGPPARAWAPWPWLAKGFTEPTSTCSIHTYPKHYCWE